VDTLVRTLQDLVAQMMHNLPFMLMLVAGLWALNIINYLLKYRLNIFGIYPRHVFGLIGIPVSPFLHGDFNHLMFNTLPLFALANFILLQGRTVFYYVSAIIILVSGILVWLFGRRGLHIGASGLIMGYFGYLLINAYFQGTWLAIMLAIVCIYYFGGLIIHLFPTKERVSWEGHVFGFAAGILASYMVPLLLK